jgi:prepilin-type N-terminal cleavage/methylation domain-containing protein
LAKIEDELENTLNDMRTESPAKDLLRLTNMTREARHKSDSNCQGFSLVEMMVVLVVIGLMSAFAIPQLMTQRRLARSAGLTREIMANMRRARQMAMSERKAFTFSYDDVAKTITIIDHNNDRSDPNSGKAVLTAGGYPNTTGSTIVSTYALGTEGLVADDIKYGIPTGLPGTASAALDDGVSLTALVSNKLNVTFQRDGSVIKSTGIASDRIPQDIGLYIYNNKAPAATAAAISVLGASGRVKIWRYNNVTKYVE